MECMSLGRFIIDKTKLTIGVLVLLICAMITGSVTTYAINSNNSIADEIIRFHVVANSDTDADQELKQAVRDKVLDYMRPKLAESKSIEMSRNIINNEKENIAKVAADVIASWNKDYSVYVALDKANFPTKAYGDIVFPAGEYEACRIVIGEGKGENWWCVMYPPLCYVDAAKGVVPLEGKEQLKTNLNTEQYNIVTSHKAQYKIKFKIIDFINSTLHKDNYKTKR